MISIIIPIYNMATKLAHCLDSLLLQTNQDYELILVDDGSIDDLDKVLEEYKPKFGRLKILRQNNSGANVARNRGVVEAKGEYLLFCDADIIMEQNMLWELKHALDIKPEASFAYSSFRLDKKLFRLWPYNAERLRKMPCIHTTALIRTEHFLGFDNTLKRFQDWDLWLTMAEQGRTGIWVDQVLFTTISGGTMSNWLPSFAYKLMPWSKQVKQYKAAMAIIKAKHNLT
jgi:glycosyltransferase involved in cell wall biosynthesis